MGLEDFAYTLRALRAVQAAVIVVRVRRVQAEARRDNQRHRRVVCRLIAVAWHVVLEQQLQLQRRADIVDDRLGLSTRECGE